MYLGRPTANFSGSNTAPAEEWVWRYGRPQQMVETLTRCFPDGRTRLSKETSLGRQMGSISFSCRKRVHLGTTYGRFARTRVYRCTLDVPFCDTSRDHLWAIRENPGIFRRAPEPVQLTAD